MNLPTSYDGLITVSQYLWDGQVRKQIHTLQFLATAWGAETGRPALVVNLVPWMVFRRWPRSILRYFPGFRPARAGRPAILNLVASDWRQASHDHRPIPTEAIARRIRQAAARLGMRSAILAVGDPAHARLFGHCGEAASVWCCTDDLQAGDPGRAASIAVDEGLAAGHADLVACVSEPLCARHRPAACRVMLLSNAVDPAQMRADAGRGGPIRGWPEPPRPRIVYLGYLNRRVDFPSLLAAVRRHSDKSFVFVGPEVPSDASDVAALAELRSLPNAFLLGRRDRDDLARVVGRSDLGLVPYRLDAFNRACSPLKVFEYAALGVPVIASPLPALLPFAEAVRLVHPADLADAIDEELALHDARRPGLEELVLENTWEARLRTLLLTLDPLHPIAR